MRILRLWKRPDGEHGEELVFEKMGVAKPLCDFRIMPVESAPLCREEAGHLGHESLSLMARLFRKYLDEVSLPPLKSCTSGASTNASGIPNRSSWPGCGTGCPGADARLGHVLPKTHGEEIYRVIEGIGARARRSDRRKSLPRRIATSFGAVLRDEAAADPFDVSFAATVALIRDLSERRDWLANLKHLGELLTVETDAEARGILDSAAAQMFVSRDVLVLVDALGPKTQSRRRHRRAAAAAGGGRWRCGERLAVGG